MSAVTVTTEDGIAVVTLDDGKANALSHAVLDGLGAALDRAEAESASAILMVGRPGKFSTGFDLSVMTASPHECRKLVERG